MLSLGKIAREEEERKKNKQQSSYKEAEEGQGKTNPQASQVSSRMWELKQ